ncbi:MAG: hypothetical protein IIY12_04560, partial [Clostridia bacterium]|nr:hypothetical protein [Clostridia bacterium]
ITVFAAALLVFLLGGHIDLVYTDDGFVLHGGKEPLSVSFTEVTDCYWHEGNFEPGTLIFGKGRIGFITGDYEGGSMDGLYQLYLDRGYEGDILIVKTAEDTLVVGSDRVDLHGLYERLQ